MRHLQAKHITDVDTLFDSLEWDIIELDFTIDSDSLQHYYTHLKEQLSHLQFSFTSKEYLRPDIYETFKKDNRVGNYLGNIQGWTVSWPVERDVPCPSKSQANIDMYPELQDLDEAKFYHDSVPMKVYKFGILNSMIETLTLPALRQMLIALHPAGLKVDTHTDGKTRKLHVPFYTNKDAVFTFGENRERKYHMELGKGYIINTLVPHGTENNGNTERVHLLSRVDDSFMHSLLSLNCNIADK
jgi:hypothetical protein